MWGLMILWAMISNILSSLPWHWSSEVYLWLYVCSNRKAFTLDCLIVPWRNWCVHHHRLKIWELAIVDWFALPVSSLKIIFSLIRWRGLERFKVNTTTACQHPQQFQELHYLHPILSMSLLSLPSSSIWEILSIATKDAQRILLMSSETTSISKLWEDFCIDVKVGTQVSFILDLLLLPRDSSTLSTRQNLPYCLPCCQKYLQQAVGEAITESKWVLSMTTKCR